MTNSDKPLQGRVLPPIAKAAVGAADAFSALNNVVDATREYFGIREQERTKRAEIKSYTTLETARITAAESILKDYFHQVFAERARGFDELFVRLDGATANGDGKSASEALGAIVSIAQTSPIADLGDLGKIRLALDDLDHVHHL